MNTIHCRIKLNDHADVAGRDVTPAEVIVLRHLHDRHVGGCCIKSPREGSRALMRSPSGEVRARNSMEEYQRLRKKYPMRAAPDKPNSSFLDELFPGVATGAVRLPEKFEDLPRQFALPEEILPPKPRFIRTPDVAVDEPVTEEEMSERSDPGAPPLPETPPPGPGEDLTAKTLAELKEIAEDYGIEVPKSVTKAALLNLVAAAEKQKPAELGDT